MATRFLVENFFNLAQFPSHVITGEDETTGNEGFRVATARRHARDHYTPQTANVGRYVEAACDRVRSADMLVIDRNSNLAGETVRIQASNQAAFTTSQEVSFTVPSSTFYGDVLTASHPVRTEEGATVIKFTAMAFRYWRVEVDAMGTGEKPQIGGLWLGQSASPTTVPLPFDDEPKWLDRIEIRAGLPSAFTRTGKTTAVRVMLTDEAEWSKFRYHFGSLFWRGQSMWYVADTDFGERAWLSYAPAGTNGAPQSDRPARDVTLSLAELQPVLP